MTPHSLFSRVSSSPDIGTSVITRTWYNLAGLEVEQRRGYSVESPALFEHVLSVHDLAGRRTRETRKDGTDERHTDWTYDDFGRVGTVEAPVSGTTSYTYGFSGGLPFTSVENELR